MRSQAGSYGLERSITATGFGWPGASATCRAALRRGRGTRRREAQCRQGHARQLAGQAAGAAVVANAGQHPR